MIPKIIHQTWNVEQVPERWLGFQESWRKNHPGYEYRFWTDGANRAFIAEAFPAFLPVYDGYRHQVNRADLARYLIVCHHGGVYVDLDCKSLRPLDDLLCGRELVFGLEPQSHVNKPAVASRGFRRLVGNALFASVPRHPFWQHLFPILFASKDQSNVLEAAGPFALTRACDSYPRPQEITILPAKSFYPLDHFLQPIAERTEAEAGNGPYAIHYWAGSWWRSAVLNNAWSRVMAARAATSAGEDR
jgi:mannosyltransferase OCH1-like enzyme